MYVTLAEKTLSLIYFRPTIIKKKQKDLKGYRATIEDSCAYQDLVAGYLQTSQSVDGVIQLGKSADTDFQIVVAQAIGGAVTIYPTTGKPYQSDSQGRFLVHVRRKKKRLSLQ